MLAPHVKGAAGFRLRRMERQAVDPPLRGRRPCSAGATHRRELQGPTDLPAGPPLGVTRTTPSSQPPDPGSPTRVSVSGRTSPRRRFGIVATVLRNLLQPMMPQLLREVVLAHLV